MRKLRTLLFTFLLLFLLAGTAEAASYQAVRIQDVSGQFQTRTARTVSLTLDGVPLETDVPAFIQGGRTLVPVRVISEGLKAAVTWKQDTRQVQIENADISITLTIGSAEAVVNGQAVPLYDGVPATLAAVEGVASRTMVPVRFVSEQLGAIVDFDNETSTVLITSAQEQTYELTAPQLADGVISVTCGEEAAPNIFTLPGRVVIDFPSGILADSPRGRVEVGGTAVSAVRYNQFDEGYDVAHVARVVLDLREGFSVDDLTIDLTEGVLTVLQPEFDPEETPGPEPEIEPEVPDGAPLIVLDAGHGGTDIGAPYFGWNEKDLTLPITLEAGTLLENAGYRVEYTRREDATVSLAARTEQAYTQAADLFVSLHANAYPQNPLIEGLETYYLVGGERAKILAEYIHSEVLAATGAADRETRTANFYVLRNTTMPAVLVETGYMTNEAECGRLVTPEYQSQLAQGIAAGIIRYLESAAP